MRCPGRLVVRAFCEHVDPGFRLAGEHRQQAAPGASQKYIGVLCQLFKRHTIEPAHEMAEMAQAVMGRLVALKQSDQFI
ncbi:hypothetical protein D9M70_365340 [compost metagenome]